MTTIAPVHDIHQPELALALQHALDNKTKPVGSLGRLEEIDAPLRAWIKAAWEAAG